MSKIVALLGIATGAAYLGSFCLMLRMAPDNEQANEKTSLTKKTSKKHCNKNLKEQANKKLLKAQGMVSSLYVMADCTGAYLGSALGGLVRIQTTIFLCSL